MIEWHRGTDAMAEEWRALARQTRAEPFLWPEWFDAWFEAFGEEALIAVARRDNNLVAVLPLQESRSVLTSPTNWHTPMFGAVGESTDAVAAVARAALATRPRRLSLSFVDRGDPLLGVLQAAAEGAGYRTLDVAMLRSPYLELNGGWDQIWGGLGSKRRNTIKRRKRRLEERGRLELAVNRGGGDVGRLLDDALRVEALGWKGKRGTAIAADPATDRFYRRVAAAAADRGALRLALLRLDERLIAFDFSIECNEHHYLLKTGFDPDLRECAPGIVLRSMMIRRAADEGIRWYEFLGKEDPYKLEWTGLARERRRLHAFAPTPAGFAHLAAFRYGRPAAKRALGLRRR